MTVAPVRNGTTRGHVSSNKGGPVKNPTPGPVFHPAVQALRAKVPRHTRTYAGWTAGFVPKITYLASSFDGGTNGTTISPANSGTSGNAFDTAGITATGTAVYSNAQAAHGEYSLEVAAAATNDTAQAKWSAASYGTQTQTWFREYLYFTANPANGARVFLYANASGNCAYITVNSSGKLVMQDSANSTMFTFATAIPLNYWFRIEGSVINSATGGLAALSLYSLDSMVALESHLSAATFNTRVNGTSASFGISASAGGSVSPYWLDGVGISNTGALGPLSGEPLPPGFTQSQDSISLPSVITTFPSM